jgi:hypothetical protein
MEQYKKRELQKIKKVRGLDEYISDRTGARYRYENGSIYQEHDNAWIHVRKKHPALSIKEAIFGLEDDHAG